MRRDDWGLLKAFSSRFWVESVSENEVEFHISVPECYESLWLIKLDSLVVTREEAAELSEEVLAPTEETTYAMLIEYSNQYWRVKHENAEVEFHIRVPVCYKPLWMSKLSEIKVSEEEALEYKDEV